MLDLVQQLFLVETTFIHIMGYDMSYLEFFGTILNILCVYLVTKNNIWNWVIGNIAVVLFAVLFFQIQLYADFFEQIYFFITGCYGWFVWKKLQSTQTTSSNTVIDNIDSTITNISTSSRKWYVLVTIIGTLVLGYAMSQIHMWLPTIFVSPATFPYLDSFTTVLSFVATILMAHKHIQCWYLWIIVDVIGIGLYAVKEVYLVAILYGIFLVLATKGYYSWKSKMIGTHKV